MRNLTTTASPVRTNTSSPSTCPNQAKQEPGTSKTIRIALKTRIIRALSVTNFSRILVVRASAQQTGPVYSNCARKWLRQRKRKTRAEKEGDVCGTSLLEGPQVPPPTSTKPNKKPVQKKLMELLNPPGREKIYIRAKEIPSNTCSPHFYHSLSTCFEQQTGPKQASNKPQALQLL